MAGRAIIVAFGASATLWGCGSEQRLACSGNQISGDGPRCTPGARLRLTGTGRSLRPAWRGYFTDRGPRGWKELQAAAPGRLRIVHRAEVPAPLGRFTIRPGDLVHNGQRAEMKASVADTGGREGGEDWYAWSTLLPPDLHPTPATTFNVMTQFHATRHDTCDPSLQVILDTKRSPARLQLWTGGGRLPARTCIPQYRRIWDLGPARLGHWDDFVLHVRWSASADRGLVELTRSGRAVVPATRFPTLYLGENAYLKQGFYHQPFPTVSRIYQTGVTRFTAAPPRGP